MTLTKAGIIKALFTQNIFTKPQSAQVIDTLFELIKQSLQNGEDVLVSGFGKFSVQEKQVRRGRNPQTGEPMMLPRRRVVTLKCSGVLRTRMNGGETEVYGIHHEIVFHWKNLFSLLRFTYWAFLPVLTVVIS